jgi:hypothetical protein
MEGLNMNPNKVIKVIKNAHRETECQVAEGRARPDESAREMNREIAGHVADWVKEFQQRRGADARGAFARLFAEPLSSLNSVS